ncbi:hypothetical protein ACDY97_31150 [Rhizobium mongolense]|uniref:hypothetical protein n=1 Tax=Rhizobium mongolense TaxID=57676 RepID=UPI003558B943
MAYRGWVRAVVASGLAIPSLLPVPAFAEPAYVAVVREYVDTVVRPMVSTPMVLAAIREQNAKFSDVSSTDIQVLDSTYRSEVETGALQMVSAVLSTPVSRYLKEKQDASQGVIVEFFITDRNGLNVGESRVTTDFWQADENKYLQTFARDSDETFVDRAERDETTQILEAQASFTIRDEAGAAIGIATVTVALDAM